MSIKEQLIEQLSQPSELPFLFVGSGMSLRYLDIDSWVQLLRRFAEKTGVPYEQYVSRTGNDLPMIATQIAETFHNLWWDRDEYAASRATFKGKVSNQESPLKIAIAAYMAAFEDRGPSAAMQAEVEMLKSVTVDGLITTNWDCFLESLFPQYETFIGQEHLLFSQSYAIAEIYKIHGCRTEPDSMVLTKKDYDGFRERNPYLAAKLLTVFVEHPIVFLGYSITDPHIQSILAAIASCMTEPQREKLSDRLFFIDYDFADKGDRISQRHEHNGLPLTHVRTRNFVAVYEALASKKRTVSPKVLRQIKERIYELIRTNDPKTEQYVQRFEDLETTPLPAYAGIGALRDDHGNVGYDSFKPIDILRDIVFDEHTFDANRLLTRTYGRLIVGNARWLPIFRYLEEAGRIVDGVIMHDQELTQDVIDRSTMVDPENYYPSASYAKKRPDVVSAGSVDAVRQRFGEERAITLIPLLRREQVNLDSLQSLLREKFDEMTRHGHPSATDFKRLVCFYDWMKYGPKMPSTT